MFSVVSAKKKVSCPTCSSAPVVFDKQTGRAVRFCVPCRREVNSSPSHPPLPHDPPPPPHDTSSTIPLLLPSHRPANLDTQLVHPQSPQQTQPRMGLPTPPGSGSQSWISLGLALAESQLSFLTPLEAETRCPLINLSVGPPTPTPSSRRSPLTSVPLIVTNLLPRCFHRGNAVVTPPHIASMLTVWLSEIVSSFEAPLAPQPQDSSVCPPEPNSSTAPFPSHRTALDGLRNCVRLVLFVSPGSLKCPDDFYSTLSGLIVARRFNHIGNARAYGSGLINGGGDLVDAPDFVVVSCTMSRTVNSCAALDHLEPCQCVSCQPGCQSDAGG